jgi:sporulation protein YqfC
MNNYIKELISICKLPFNEIIDDFKIVQISSKVIYVSNYKKIIDYTNTHLVLKVKNNTIEIEGENLFLSQINKSEIVVKGTIISIKLGMKNEKK